MIEGYFRFDVPDFSVAAYDPLAMLNREWRRDAAWTGEAAWLRQAVFLGATREGEPIVLGTREDTDSASSECRVHWLTFQGSAHRSAESFTRFIEDVCFKMSDGQAIEDKIFVPD